MKLIIGLGNPGSQYTKTRHNAGFILLDLIQQKLFLPECALEKKFQAEICEGVIDGQKYILAKPQTFMNKSGESVQKLLQFFKLTPQDLVVLHDDLDIDLGSFKVSNDATAAGHNGVQDIFDKLGTQQIKRVRIGIEGAERKKTRTLPGEVFVLQNFTPEELHLVENLVDEILPKL